MTTSKKVEVIGGRITHVEGEKKKDGVMQGLNIGITFDDVKVKGDKVDVDYVYSATYGGDIGNITIKGTLYTRVDKKTAKEIENDWKKDEKDRKVPIEYATQLLSVINYTGSANGVFIARVVGLQPPLVPPKLQLEKK